MTLSLQPGTRLGDYELVTHIASGGFGSVWRARHVGSGAEAAVKVLHGDLLTSAEALGRFQREAQTIAELRHPGVVELRAVGSLTDGRPYLAMELIHGIDLSALIARRGPLPVNEVAALIEPLCAALDAAHQLGIVHRDIKATNVMLADTGRLVLLDFGVAKLLAGDAPSLTMSRCTVGTPTCMAPEQIRAEPIDRRADVYAVGALLYQLLTAVPPFAAAPAIVAEYIHLHGPRPRPSDRIDVSAAVDEVVARAMAIRRDDRYGTAPELAAAFARAIAPATTAADRVPGIAVYAIAHASAPDLADPDDALLDDLESLLPRIERELRAAGFAPTRQSATAALFERAGDPAAVDAARAQLIDAHRAVSARPGRDPRIEIRLVFDQVGGIEDIDRLIERAEAVRGDGVFPD